MISAFNNLEEGWSPRLEADAFEEIQRTKGIMCTLHEKNRRCKRTQDLVAHLCRIAAATERIAETNKTLHRFLERYVAADPATHAFADEDDRCVCLLPRLGEGVTMSGDKSWRRIRSPPAFAHIGIIK